YKDSIQPSSASTVYTTEDFEKEILYNTQGQAPVIAYFDGEYLSRKFGFDMHKVCTKFQAWETYATNDKDLADYMISRFTPVIDLFDSNFGDKRAFWVQGKDEVYAAYDVSTDNLYNNVTVWLPMIKALVYTYTADPNDEIIQKFLPEGKIDDIL